MRGSKATAAQSRSCTETASCLLQDGFGGSRMRLLVRGDAGAVAGELHSVPKTALARSSTLDRPPCLMIVADSRLSPVSACWQDGSAEATHALPQPHLVVCQPEGIKDDCLESRGRIRAACCDACACIRVRLVRPPPRGTRRGCV
jgi:hypothetical protein